MMYSSSLYPYIKEKHCLDRDSCGFTTEILKTENENEKWCN